MGRFVEVTEAVLAELVVVGEVEVPDDWADTWGLVAMRARIAVIRPAQGQAFDDF